MWDSLAPWKFIPNVRSCFRVVHVRQHEPGPPTTLKPIKMARTPMPDATMGRDTSDTHAPAPLSWSSRAQWARILDHQMGGRKNDGRVIVLGQGGGGWGRGSLGRGASRFQPWNGRTTRTLMQTHHNAQTPLIGRLQGSKSKHRAPDAGAAKCSVRTCAGIRSR